MKNIKQKVINELKKVNFPDLSFLYSDEVLGESLEILKYLLEEEKQKFEELLKIEKKDIEYETFEDEWLLDYFWSLLNHFESINNTKIIRKIISDFRPKYQDFLNYVAYSKEYYEMYVYCDKKSYIDNDQKRVMQLRIKDFKDRWINLSKEKQDRIKKLNKILAELYEKFSNNVIDDKWIFEYLIEDKEVIKNLPKDVLKVAEKNAIEKQKKGWLFFADHTASIAIMKYCTDQNIRKYFEESRNTFASDWKYDNRKIVLDILKYRKEKAVLLWYKNYAELSLNNKMADSSKQVIDLIESICEKAKIKAWEEINELKSYFWIDNIESYDLAYYSRQLKEIKYEVDDKELKKYFELNNVLNYLFNFVEKFYWIQMKEINVNTYSKDIGVYEVYKNNKLISYYFYDLFYRKEKKSWAWFNDLREKYNFKWIKRVSLVVNVCNFQKSTWKILLTKLDIETMFHEFGHAIHEMLSESKLSELGWMNVEWDAIELPSQILENWVNEKSSLVKLTKHYKTWENISNELLEKIDKLKTFMEGCFVLRQNEFALLDMYLHCSNPPNTIKDLDKKIIDIINKISIFKRWEKYKMYASFTHIFSWWYAAWYYSYIWAEIIEADVFERIKKLWMFDRKIWEKFIDTILWQWSRKPFSELFYDFMWRDVNDSAFLKRKGL